MAARARLGPIGQISRQVRDIGAAVAWYRDVLGLPHLFTFGTLAFFDCQGTRLFLSEGDREIGEPGGDSVLYFRTDDIEATYRQLFERGVTFKGAPHMIHRHESGVEEWMAFFEDVDGKLLALMSQVGGR
jgi:catechol 2,3-dioxygenase-like lactoylglutathione lyase family enzyme